MWKEKIILNDGEQLKHESSKSQGFMQEEDVDIYSVVREDGSKTGTVIVTEHIAVKGFKKTVWVVQKDNDGTTVVDVRL